MVRERRWVLWGMGWELCIDPVLILQSTALQTTATKSDDMA